MPLWGTARPGGASDAALNFTDLRPGDDETLFDGTETIANGSKSIAFARGSGMMGMDGGTTYQMQGCPNSTTWEIQGSNGVPYGVTLTLANLDASFVAISPLMTGNAAYTDLGRMSFYRFHIVTFQAGDVPVADVKR